MKIGFLYNFFRWEKGHFVLELIFEAARTALKKEANIELINFSHLYEDRSCFFKSADIPEVENWFLYQEGLADVSQFEFDNDVFDVDFVIGFELSVALCDLLSQKKIKYINFNVHPVRFLPDLLWSVSTNSEAIAEVLSRYEISLNDVTEYVNDIIINTAVHQRVLQRRFIKQDAVAIFCQWDEDSSVLVNKKFENLYDYRDQIMNMTVDYQEILFVVHPGGSNLIPLYKLIKFLGRGRICNFNSYALLSNDRVKKVITLSSSIGVESRYWGKDVSFLIGPALRAGGTMVSQNDKSYTIGQDIFAKNFWFNLLGRGDGISVLPQVKNMIPNRVRRLIGKWAFDEDYSVKISDVFIIGALTRKEEKAIAEMGMISRSVPSDFLVDFRKKFDEFLYWSEGLSDRETDGRWIEKRVAKLEVLLPDCVSYGGHIKLRVIPYINEYAKKQDIIWNINNGKQGILHIEDVGIHEINIPIDEKIAAYGSARVAFLFPDAVRPCDLGLSEDRRLLSVKVVTCQYCAEYIEKAKVSVLEKF